MWPLARQQQTWHVMLLSCVQGILFPLRKNSRLVRTIASHTAGALLQASGAGLAKARAAVVQQLWFRMSSDVHIQIHVSSKLRKGLCRQFARCTMMLGLRLQVCRSIQNSPSRSPEGEKQLRAQIRGHLMREAHCYCHCDSKAAPRARHPAADHRVGSCRHGFHRGSLRQAFATSFEIQETERTAQLVQRTPAKEIRRRWGQKSEKLDSCGLCLERNFYCGSGALGWVLFTTADRAENRARAFGRKAETENTKNGADGGGHGV